MASTAGSKRPTSVHPAVSQQVSGVVKCVHVLDVKKRGRAKILPLQGFTPLRAPLESQAGWCVFLWVSWYSWRVLCHARSSNPGVIPAVCRENSGLTRGLAWGSSSRKSLSVPATNSTSSLMTVFGCDFEEHSFSYPPYFRPPPSPCTSLSPIHQPLLFSPRRPCNVRIRQVPGCATPDPRRNGPSCQLPATTTRTSFHLGRFDFDYSSMPRQ